MPTYFPSRGGDKQWLWMDAEGKVLGRLAAQAASLLMGKHKPTYSTFLDTGDYLIITNAAKVRLTGQKSRKKIYRHHTGFPGGIVERRAELVRSRHPAQMVREAIEGMLPKTKLGKAMVRKLHVYAGDQHPHAGQKPVPAPSR